MLSRRTCPCCSRRNTRHKFIVVRRALMIYYKSVETKTGATGHHLPGCPHAKSSNGSPYQEHMIGLNLPGLTRLLKKGIDLSFTLTHGVRAMSVASSITTLNMVDTMTSVAFRLTHVFNAASNCCFGPIHLELSRQYLCRLLQADQSGPASPRDVDVLGGRCCTMLRTLARIIFYTIEFPFPSKIIRTISILSL